MSAEHTEELEQALAALAALERAEARPDRHHARALLVPLGRLFGSGGTDAAEPWLARARRAGAGLGEAWIEAVRAELALACAEYVHAVDARYLELPNYDFAYTFGARERLEARLLAARALALEPPATLLEGVRRADELLARYDRESGSRGKPE